MPIGFIASFILHGVLLGWALLAVVTTPPLNIPRPEPVEVALVTEGDIVRLKQGNRDAKLLEAEGKDGPAKEPPKKEPPKPAPPPPQAAAPPPPPAPVEPTPPPPEPAKPEPPKPELPKSEPAKPDPIAEKIAAVPPPPELKPEPKVEPGPTPDDQQALAEKLKEQERAAAKAAADAKAKADAKTAADAKAKADAKARADAAAKAKAVAEAKAKEAAKSKDLASLVNDALQSTPDKSATNAPPKALIDRRATAAQAAGQKTAANAKGPAAGAPDGTDTVLTADKASMLAILMKNNVRRCWNINAGLEGAAKLVVKLEVKLNTAGQLIGEPRVTNSGNGQQFEDAVNSARRAVIDCQPYTNLPPDLYNGGWDFMLLTLDPAKMF